MSVDTNEWLQTAGAAVPPGDDLEYDPQFLALQQAALGKREQQFGTTIIAAEPPDWHQVEKIANVLLARTCDIRIYVSRAQACLEQYGLARYATELDTLAQALEQEWALIHPQITVEDGQADPLPRMNALAALGDAGSGVRSNARSLRDTVLIKNEYGTARLRDAQALLEGSPAAAQVQYPGGRARLIEDLRTALVLEQPHVMAIPAVLSALVRIRETVTRHLGEAWVPDLNAIERTLTIVLQALDLPAASAQHASQTDEPADGTSTRSVRVDAERDSPIRAGDADARPAVSGVASSAPRDTWRHATIATRSDAIAMLEKVSTYFQQHEPSHPAPLLIRRIQQLIPLDFYDIVKNLAPQGLSEVESIMARTPEGEHSLS